MVNPMDKKLWNLTCVECDVKKVELLAFTYSQQLEFIALTGLINFNAKGQKISRAIFSAFNSSKKRTTKIA